jgi:hypothetical protein
MGRKPPTQFHERGVEILILGGKLLPVDHRNELGAGRQNA